MITCGAAISPLIFALQDSVRIACSPWPWREPSTVPSTCRRPLKTTSPRILVPTAISDVVSAAGCGDLFLLPSIACSLGCQHLFPPEIAFCLPHLSAAVGFDVDAVRHEPFRKQ